MPEVSSSTSGAIVVMSPETLKRFVVTFHHVIMLVDISHISELGPMKKRVTKKGRMASTSTMFIPSLRKAHLSGAPARRMKYSRVNQAMHTVSIMARVGLSIVFPDAS